jgi:hypothetical protein
MNVLMQSSKNIQHTSEGLMPTLIVATKSWVDLSDSSRVSLWIDVSQHFSVAHVFDIYDRQYRFFVQNRHIDVLIV